MAAGKKQYNPRKAQNLPFFHHPVTEEENNRRPTHSLPATRPIAQHRLPTKAAPNPQVGGALLYHKPIRHPPNRYPYLATVRISPFPSGNPRSRLRI